MRRLQCLLFLVIIASIQCWTDKGKGKLKNAERKCIEELGLDGNAIKEALTTRIYPNEIGFKSFVLCLGIKQGLLFEDGRVNPDGFKKIVAHEELDPSIALEIIEKCSKVRDTPEDTAYSTFLCYQDVVPEFIKV